MRSTKLTNAQPLGKAPISSGGGGDSAREYIRLANVLERLFLAIRADVDAASFNYILKNVADLIYRLAREEGGDAAAAVTAAKITSIMRPSNRRRRHGGGTNQHR